MVDQVAAGAYVATAEAYPTTTIVAGADGNRLLVDPAVTAADWLRAPGGPGARAAPAP
ncbi:MAG TPA: hypothetical protein VHF26_06230 [Trebonia sp.]|nr:hypothetical protein [Trebonia sp.]